jgi:hypothetical protein
MMRRLGIRSLKVLLGQMVNPESVEDQHVVRLALAVTI